MPVLLKLAVTFLWTWQELSRWYSAFHFFLYSSLKSTVASRWSLSYHAIEINHHLLKSIIWLWEILRCQRLYHSIVMFSSRRNTVSLQKYCFFYLYSEDSYETCGPRRHGDPIDVPKLFIVRYKRNSTESTLRPKKKVKSIWDRFEDEDVNLASQLVARYNGSDNLYEVYKF